MKHSKILSAVFGLTLFASAALSAAAPKTEGNPLHHWNKILQSKFT